MEAAPLAGGTVPSRPEYPLWTIAGPGAAALVGAYLLTSDLGDTGRTWALDLHSTYATIMTGFVVFLVAMAIGAAGGFLGRRMALVLGLVGGIVLGVGALGLGVAPNETVLIAARALCGIGTGLAWGASVAIGLAFGARRGPVAIGLAAAGVVVAALAPFISGFITTTMDWRLGYFLVLLPLGIAFVLTVVGLVVASQRPPNPAN